MIGNSLFIVISFVRLTLIKKKWKLIFFSYYLKIILSIFNDLYSFRKRIFISQTFYLADYEDQKNIDMRFF